MSSGHPVRVMTYNIRTGLANDGDNNWPLRRHLVLEAIRDNDPDLVGLQEPTPEQWDFLSGKLKAGWEGHFPSGAATSGSVQGILFRRDRFRMTGNAVFWLSDTPEVPGSITFPNHWGARTAVLADLEDLQTGRKLVFCAVHFDTHPGSWMPSARVLETGLERHAAKAPLFVVGDFNCAARDRAWVHLTRSAGLKDAWAELGVPDEGLTTFNAFHAVAKLPLDREDEFLHWLRAVCEGPDQVELYRRYLMDLRNFRIDWVLYRGPFVPRQAWADTRTPGGRLPSDHYPVIASLEWAG